MQVLTFKMQMNFDKCEIPQLITTYLDEMRVCKWIKPKPNLYYLQLKLMQTLGMNQNKLKCRLCRTLTIWDAKCNTLTQNIIIKHMQTNKTRSNISKHTTTWDGLRSKHPFNFAITLSSLEPDLSKLYECIKQLPIDI